jgi:hypothetical protein
LTPFLACIIKEQFKLDLFYAKLLDLKEIRSKGKGKAVPLQAFRSKVNAVTSHEGTEGGQNHKSTFTLTNLTFR